MPHPQARPAQYADLFSLPDTLVGEIIDGELYAHPRPAPRHALAASAIGMEIGNPFQRSRGGPGGWWILDEPELHLGADVLVPDLAGWRRERLPQLPETAWIALAPDWVCEVISPSTARVDRMTKMPLYAANGIPYCWLVDPVARTLEAFKLRDHQWVLLASFVDDADVAAEPFEAVPFKLDALWAD
ncbi:Uma2 family endonuclease [Thiorhodococcus minor]|uniref:Uma2 family endonuclease n=1 Tax=Thiorhodococcus minor TaxID=57489 RepID=A0A6M0K691_9GAMM|nr:Uma2 family endonuclease [Thiorhodococcus minor]NEV65272.1 Uma2 family endonuclease [Thiorhodococcus minor]